MANTLDKYTKVVAEIDAFYKEHPELEQLLNTKAELEGKIKEEVRTTGQEMANKAFKVTIDRPYSKWIDFDIVKSVDPKLAKLAIENGVVKETTNYEVDLKAFQDFARENDALTVMQQAYKEQALSPRVSIKLNKD